MLAYPVPGSKIVGTRGLRKSEHENKTRGNFYPVPLFAYLSLSLLPRYLRA